MAFQRNKPMAADGTTDFSILQNELKGKSKSIILVTFDNVRLKETRPLGWCARAQRLRFQQMTTDRTRKDSAKMQECDRTQKTKQRNQRSYSLPRCS
nr:hypothetical protein [Bradyrhizobium tropiciagri]